MAFVTETPTQREVPEIDTSTQYGSATEPLKIISAIEGTVWRADFFLQLLRDDDSSSPLDLGIDPTLQQYIKVHNYELMLQGDLTFEADDGQGNSTVTGEGLLYPGIVPNVNDHFVADLSDRGKCLFIIKEVTRLSYAANTAHRIEFELYEILSVSSAENLALKTVEERYFDNVNKDLSLTARTSSAGRTVDIGKLVAYYNDEFFNERSETILYPDDGKLIYDPFVAEFWSKVVPRVLRGSQPKPKLYSVKNGKYRKKISTIWDLLLTATCYGKDSIPRQTENVATSAFSSDSIHYSLSTSPIDSVAYPKSIPTLRTDGLTPVDEAEPYYVLSKAFYDSDEANYTVLDKFVHDFLMGTRPDYSSLVDPVNNLPNLTPEERFYQLPVYFLLLKSAVN